MAQGLEQPSDFTVLPLDQHHFQMRFASGTLLNLHTVALKPLAFFHHSDCGLLGLILGEFSPHRDQVGPHHFMARIGEIARQDRIVGEQQKPAGRLIEPPDCMQIAQVRRLDIENRLPVLFITMRRDDPFGFMKEDKSFG